MMAEAEQAAKGAPSICGSLQQLAISGNRLTDEVLTRLGTLAHAHGFCLLARPQQPQPQFA